MLVVVEVEFDFVVLPLVVEFVVVVVVEELLLLLFDIGLVVVAGVVAAGDAVLAGLVVFALFVAVLVFDSPGQAAPNKPNVKTAERAITFFISIIFSCLLQRMFIFILFNDRPKTVEFLNLFWNNGQYKRQKLRSQLKKWKKIHFREKKSKIFF